ncbi:MAG: Holliday junction helicase RuvA, holliday junction helicase RuvA [Parcubacteria group bacterium]|nr:Holliday junction helicase RuvA, holliday junction helicase RuvA [Parcubacteria group bacterium]
MIATLKGTVLYKDLAFLVIDVGGVGYRVAVTTDVAVDAIPSQPIFLWTYLAVRETALDLFGFLDRETLGIFELLITISGIGPKTALGILNVASPSMLRQAVAENDTSYLTRVSGIGKKNAEKIVLELRDKLVTTAADQSINMRAEGDALEALVSLGYSERDVRDALKKVPKEIESTNERVKQALKILSQSK